MQGFLESIVLAAPQVVQRTSNDLKVGCMNLSPYSLHVKLNISASTQRTRECWFIWQNKNMTKYDKNIYLFKVTVILLQLGLRSD